MSTEAEIKRVYERWHEAVVARDLDALMGLYAEDSVLESSLILVLEKEKRGVLKGRDVIRKHFAGFFEMMATDSSVELYRPGVFYSSGKNVVWEYPSKSPKGEQLDVVESMDIEDGKIAYHRVYWGWIGFIAMNALAERLK